MSNPPRESRPRRARKNRLQPQTGSGCRRSGRLQKKPPVSYAQNAQPNRTKRTHSVEPIVKSSTPPPSIHSLTEENLRLLNEQEMSKRKKTGEETMTNTKRTMTRSKSAPSTNGGYRIHRLKAVNILFDGTIPEHLQAAIDDIVRVKAPSEERRAVIRNAAERFYHSCRGISNDRSMEGDFVGVCRDALRDLLRPGIFIRQEAHWRCEFKPGISEGNPIFRVDEGTPAIKTPCPDITVGIGEETFLETLSSPGLGLSKTQARNFVRRLETEYDSVGPDGERLGLTILGSGRVFFPIVTVEAKAYLTGKQVSEAQNEAAVSGASALNFQLRLTEMAKSSAAEFDDKQYKCPLFFSICTEGPYHELWVHYTFVEEGQRMFDMKLVKICNVMLKETVEDFFFAVDGVLSWGAGAFRQSVVDRMRLVAIKKTLDKGGETNPAS
ncbi:hypothetical protein PV08_11244 [Exophiala spinifera]|uniref:DUF7924 domain-containing protein n=1 Tax=Exophiala spinifera TaxID=91928 RepID=A0A0D1ZB79_9EURO|nr:uncharacterized protein PV08_11244 [Exophiala spinifera]KIW10282.1 hypothetical protein PV08_11244 [Exophiala spinifera]